MQHLTLWRNDTSESSLRWIIAIFCKEKKRKKKNKKGEVVFLKLSQYSVEKVRGCNLVFWIYLFLKVATEKLSIFRAF